MIYVLVVLAKSIKTVVGKISNSKGYKDLARVNSLMEESNKFLENEKISKSLLKLAVICIYVRSK